MYPEAGTYKRVGQKLKIGLEGPFSVDAYESLLKCEIMFLPYWLFRNNIRDSEALVLGPELTQW